jgi:hypothetical protein
MNLRYLTICGGLGLFVFAAGCQSENAATPSAPGTASPGAPVVADVSIASPTLASADGAQIKNVNQPVTLAIGSTVATGSRSLTYTIEVASDGAFSNIVYTKTGLAAGASQVIDKLPAGATYYWRARGVSGSVPGPNSKTRSFTIGPQVLLSAPVPASPGSNAVLGAQVTLTVNDVQKSGPAGPVLYRFQVADSSSFGHVVFDSTVPEQGGATSVNVSANLNNATYWWRVQASDVSNAVTTPYSGPISFQVQLFDPSQAIFVDNPPDLGTWPQTATITSVDLSDFVIVDFDKRQGPDQWPEAGFGAGGIQYTLGMCFNLGGQWYCSAAIQFWTGRELTAGGPASNIARNWYYDIRWGPMKGHQPDQGELVAIFVAQGNNRDNGNTYRERSNFVVLPFGGTYNAISGSSAGRSALKLFKRR